MYVRDTRSISVNFTSLRGKVKTMSKCGTPNGPQEHRLRGEPVCHQCKEAAADYMRDYRLRKAMQQNPEKELQKAVETAAAALDRLRSAREEYKRVTGKSAVTKPSS